MATHHFTPLLGKRIRVTELDGAGAVVPGPGGRNVVTDGFITVSLSSVVEDGVEIIQKNAWGALCVNEKFSDSFKRFNVEIRLCGVNPVLLSMASNAEEYADYAGDAAGITVAEGPIDKQFGFELWTGLNGRISAAASGYLLLPFLQAGVIGDFSVDGENSVNFTLTRCYTKGGNAWGVGPFDVVYNDAIPPVAAPLPSALDPLDHLLLMDTGIAPPAAADEPVTNPV